MDFTGSISTFRARMMPSLAILRHDLRTLRGSWLVRLWLVATVLLTLLVLASSWEQAPSARLIASLLFPYLVFPWFLVVIVLGVAPVTGSRAEALADGILSRPVARHEYLLAAWAARVITVLSVYLVVILPAVILVASANRKVADDKVTVYGIIAALGVVALVQTFLISLGFLLGTLLKRPLLVVVVLVFVWFPANLILTTFNLEEFSPISLNQAIATNLLKQPWRQPEGGSQDPASQEDLEALSQQAAHFMSVLSGAAPPKPADKSPDFFNREEFDDFSLFRVVLGYGIPTLLAVALAVLIFCKRDL